jgi:anti-sigma-K factor RskA
MSQEGTPLGPDECAANAAPYVLGALSDAEREAFGRHLDSCAVCREEVASLQVVAAALPAAAPQVSAPSSLKERVMAAVHEDARAREAREEIQDPHRQRSRAQPSAAAGRPRARRGWRPVLAGLGASAVVVVLAIAAVLALAPGGSTSAGPRVIHAEVLAPRSPGRPAASAQLLLGSGHAQLTIANLAPSAPGRVYQVWLKGSGAPQPTDALFTVASNGDATVAVPGVAHTIKEVMVTSEPIGGSRLPTRPPVIIARLS